MPPTLALLICTAFVLVLLRLERKQTRNVSHALWLPTIWVMSCGSKPLSFWFGTGIGAEDMSIESGSPLDRLFLAACIGAGLLILSRRKLDWQTIKKENVWHVV